MITLIVVFSLVAAIIYATTMFFSDEIRKYQWSQTPVWKALRSFNKGRDWDHLPGTSSGYIHKSNLMRFDGSDLYISSDPMMVSGMYTRPKTERCFDMDSDARSRFAHIRTKFKERAAKADIAKAFNYEKERLKAEKQRLAAEQQEKKQIEKVPNAGNF